MEKAETEFIRVRNLLFYQQEVHKENNPQRHVRKRRRDIEIRYKIEGGEEVLCKVTRVSDCEGGRKIEETLFFMV